LKVILGSEETAQMMDFNPKMKISEVFSLITSHVSLAQSNFELVLESDDKDEPVTLDENEVIQNYVTSDNCRLRFISKAKEEDESSEHDQDCNIWDEPPDSPANITFDKDKEQAIQNIETATFNKLVERVTSPDEYDVDFVNVFVLMYHVFASDERLWLKLEERFNVPKNYDQGVRQKIQMRVFIFIKHWVEKVLDLNPQVKLSIQHFAETISQENNDFQIFAKTIVSRLTSPPKVLEEGQSNIKPPIPFLPKNIGSKPTFFDFDSDVEIARQLTLRSFSIFKRIKPAEFFKAAWTKEKYKHLSPNVLDMIAYYNSVTAWITTLIVQEKAVRTRAKLLQKIINIAEELNKLNNFHLLSAFISAISNYAIDRLVFTLARLSKRHRAILSDLSAMMSMEGSFKNFRNALAAAKPPCVPFLGVYLTDLIFIGEGNPDMIENRVNFVKHKFVYGVISTIQAYQTTVYNLEAVDSIQNFLDTLPQLPEKEVYKLSLEIEPRGATRADIS